MISVESFIKPLDPELSHPDSNESDYEVSEPLDLSPLNQCLEKIGENPIVNQRLQQQKYH